MGPPPPVPQAVNQPLGVSTTGIPLTWRGLIGLEAAGFSDATEYSALALTAIADVPLVDRVFFTARLPFGLAVSNNLTGPVIGNPMLGTRGVLRPGRGFWVGLGAAVGLPLVSDQAYGTQATYQAPPVPHGLWNLHEYFPNAVPLAFAVDLEGHLDVGLVQHAAELQIGRDVGGGLRVQGVALPTFDEIENGSDFEYIESPITNDADLYQFALEPFFRLEREKFMLRTGLMMPMDSRLGPPFASSWGLRLQLGMRL
jgi:hypothetical protein